MSAAIDVPNRGESTSPGLSSPPSPNSPTRRIITPTSAAQSNAVSFAHDDVNVGGEKSGKGIGAKNTTPSGTIRKPRKKKDPEIVTPINNGNASTATVTDGQEPKVRKRAPRGTSAAYKKKQARLAEEAQAREAVAHASRPSKIRDSIPSSSLPPTNYGVPAIQTPHQNGNNEAIHISRINTQNVTPHSRPTSGQKYDPIRSSTVAPRPNSPMATATTPHKPYNNSSASASPSIYSIIDLPSHPYTFPQPPKRDSDPKASSPSENKRPRLSPPLPLSSQQSSNPRPKGYTPAIPVAPPTNPSTEMEVDTEKTLPLSNGDTTGPGKMLSPQTSTVASSSSHSPKPSRPKETAVALSSGSGLLSGSIFGTGLDSNGIEKTAPTVVLNVPLTSEHQYVNFTRLAEERYGFNALHPRLAAQRERLAKVAAAGAALENANKSGGNSGSADDMSVDLSDGDADNSNVEMGGMNDSERFLGTKSGEETGEGGAAKKTRKRMTKEDMYDKEDDFIDDAEELWLEQAATSKDGFFVYSGPLIPPGEEPTVERCVRYPLMRRVPADYYFRADGPAKRGRGNGRGRGGTTRGGGRGGGAAVATKDGAKAPGRKPRVTKAAKELMEKEKAQRENLAVLASKPVGYTIPV